MESYLFTDKSRLFLMLFVTCNFALLQAAVSPNVGACSSNPCMNSGLCTSLYNGFVCTCVNGFIGVRCERRSDECSFSDSLRCINGRCKIDPNGKSKCECNANYGGQNCNTKLNTCDYVSCNSGTCVNARNEFKCQCPNGFSGKKCQIKNTETKKCLDGCKNIQTKTNGGKCWRDSPEIIKVGWGYEHSLCNTKENCFDMPGDGIDYTDVQIKPVQAQPLDTLIFLTDIDAALYNNTFTPHVIPVEAISREAFSQCNMTHAIPIGNQSAVDEGEMLVNSSYLKTGTQYFIANVNALHRCMFGLRLNVTIKENKCIDLSNPSAKICHEHGKCYTDFTKMSYECECCEGFHGKYCESEDPCYDKPCKNNGKCNIVIDNNGIKTFRCKCPYGFTGFNCNHTVDYCDSSPCLNGAGCVSSASGFTCSCKAGFKGRNCEINEDQCASSPCRNGGICLDGDDSFTCSCLKGYKGSICEVNKDDCVPNPCRNGTCIDGIDKYHCHCKPGYTGKTCDISPDQCSSSPCVNGRCIKKGKSYECSCGIGYTGRLCEIKISLCQNTLFCLEGNSLACIDHGNNVTCSCVSGFTGDNCGVNIDDCAAMPCQHGGTCVDKVNGFDCVCAGGATGSRCEVLAETTTKKPSSTVVDTKKTTLPVTTGVTEPKQTSKPQLKITLDLQILTDKCSLLQESSALKRLAANVFNIIRSSCDCNPSNGETLTSPVVRCGDEMSGKFVAQMSIKDDKEKDLILCSLDRRIKKGHVPASDHNTYIVGINAKTAVCEEKKDDTTDHRPIPSLDSSPSNNTTGIVVGSIVAVIIAVVLGIFISLKYRNRTVREVKESDPDNVKSFLNFVYQSDVELTSPRSAWESPALAHDPSRLKYAIKKPKVAETSFSFENPGGSTSKV